MRLVLLFTWDVSLAEWKEKGLLQRELKLYEALADQGVDITLVTWGGVDDLAIAKDYPGFTIVPLYTRIAHHQSKIMRFLFSFLAPFHLKDVLKRDRTVLKTNQMWGCWVAVIAKYLYGVPLLLRTGFELFDFTLKGSYGVAREAFIHVISLIGYTAADRIFVATENDKAFVQKHFYVKTGKISVCPNWIDTDMFSPKEDIQKNGRLLFVGRLNAQKNLPALIEAVSKISYGLDIVGAGELETSLKDLAVQLKADVRFAGSVPNDALPALYRECALFILASFYEGNPKTLLEAMACGAVVLGAKVPGIREIIDSGENGILCETDAGSLAKAIMTIMAAPESQKAIGNKARAAILAHNTLAAQVAREVKSLQSMLIQ